jgi:hypothetical protein
MSKQAQPGQSQNQGEGNKTADREYRQAATEHAQSDKSKPKADEAKRAVEGQENEELEKARKDTGSRQPG